MPASVGTVWGVPDGRPGLRLVTDLTSLAEAEPYGECLTHPRGHWEVWERWRRLGSAGLQRRGLPTAIAFHEYEDFPRGRVVFHAGNFRFTLYADPRLWRPPVLGSIFRAFGLTPARCDVRSDPHYRTVRPVDDDVLTRQETSRYTPALATNPATSPSSSPRRQPAFAAAASLCPLGDPTTAVEG